MDNKSQKKNIPVLVVCIILFVIFFALQRMITANPSLTGFNGIIAQFHVMISVVLVLTNRKTGFIAGIVLNAVNLVMAVMAVVGGGQKQALPSIAISICTVIIMAIIYNYTNKNDAMHDELMEKYEQEIESKRILQEKDEVLSYLAYYDRLTQMPNRHLFMENLEDNVSRNSQCAVVCINLDDFRRVNDIYGLQTGDVLIKTYAERIEEIISDNEFAARISGDEFGIILGSGYSNQDVINFVGRVQSIFNIPVTVEGNTLGVSSSIGVAMFPRDASEAEEILRCAEKAMFMSKNNGKNKVCFYSPVV
ncbi:MAG: GGDEF domain-containing protein [Ruminococcus flavefaciens]|nr:GGDEF domain-containing protein [Ruminococcus flavefaciens]